MKWTKLLQILGVSCALAAYAAWIRSEPPADNVTVPATDIPLIRVSEAEALWRKPSTLFIDVRSLGEYAFGHIAGAIHLPEEEFEQRFPDLKARLEQAEALVVYCKNRDCGKSLWSAIRLRQQGLTKTRIFPEGWNEWIDKGLPTTPVRKGGGA